MSEPQLPEQFAGRFTGVDMGKVFVDVPGYGETNVLDIRGWGYLTGQGALALDDDEADKIQVQFELAEINARICSSGQNAAVSEVSE